MSTLPGPDGHDAFYEDAAAYALGVLTAGEHERFIAHLEVCAECREEVARLQVAADALPLAAPQLSAPPQLKQRIMGVVTGEPESPPAERQAVAEPHRRRLRDSQRAGGSWPRRWALGATAALAAAAVVLAVIALVGSGGGGGSRVVRAQVLAKGASASLRISAGRGELVLDGMPHLPPRRTYEVWVQRRGAPQPTDALFSVTSTGGATVAVPGSIAGVKAVLVTAEPLGGSRTPTSAPVLVARLG